MHVSVYLLLIAPALLATVSPMLARRLRPALAVRLLTCSAAAVAAAATWELALLGCSLLGRAPLLAERGHWSRAALAAHDPVPEVASWVAVCALLAAAATLRGRLRIRGRTLRGIRQVCRACRPAGHDLLVLAEAKPWAFAVPGRMPTVVVSTGMLRALDGPERQVLLAHERSHLRHRHDRYQLIADLAAAAHPLLGRLRRDVGYSVERWADEDAAEGVQDRALAARALARAALASQRRVTPGLAFEQLAVRHRVAALEGPQPPLRVLPALLPGLLAASAVLGAADATLSLYRLLEAALPH